MDLIEIPRAASAAFSFSIPNNQKPGFFRLIDVEDDTDEETQALCNQETGGSVSSYFNPVPSGCCNRGISPQNEKTAPWISTTGHN